MGANWPGTRCLRWGKGGLGSLLRSSILLIRFLVCPRQSKKWDGGDGDDDAKPFDRDVIDEKVNLPCLRRNEANVKRM